jgi:hypothetical protein
VRFPTGPFSDEENKKSQITLTRNYEKARNAFKKITTTYEFRDDALRKELENTESVKQFTYHIQ